MKKIILISLLALGLLGCGKEEIGQAPCSCGTVVSDGIDGDCYWLELRNHCSGNKQVFCVDGDKWMSAYIGTDFCLTNVNGW